MCTLTVLGARCMDVAMFWAVLAQQHESQHLGLALRQLSRGRVGCEILVDERLERCASLRGRFGAS